MRIGSFDAVTASYARAAAEVGVRLILVGCASHPARLRSLQEPAAEANAAAATSR